MEPRAPHGSIPAGRVARVAPLVGLAGRTAGEAVVASLRKDRAGGRAADFHSRNAERYAERLGRSRGVLMKAGQMLTVMFPESSADAELRGIYQAAFAKLLDSAPPMPSEVAVATVSAELGRPVEELFATFDPHPLAAASIGQVHAATLPDGTAVAVKVQYPGVEEALRDDLANTELLGTFLQLLFTVVPRITKLDLRGFARELSQRIADELDYLREAANQREFAAAFRGHPSIRIPEVYEELTTRRVLTMQLVDGMRYAEAVRADKELRDRWGETIFRFVCTSLGRFAMNNADPHPGNYLFHPDGSVTFLDFGCVKRFTRPQAAVIVEAQRHMIDGDVGALYRCSAAGGFLDLDDAPDPDEWWQFMAGCSRYLMEPQPFTVNREYVDDVWDAAGLRGPHRSAIRKIVTPPHFMMISRIEAGMLGVLAGLRATGDWVAIRAECHA